MIKFLIVIPCYNEYNRILKKEFRSFFYNSLNKHIHFLFVNDGSSDKTIETLNEFQKEFEQVNVLDLKKNVGKAEAVRQGMLFAVPTDYQYYGYWDADLATPLEEIKHIYSFTKNTESEALMLMGSRVKLLGSTEIKRKIGRHYIGRVFATIVSNMLKLSIYDTQCGAKLIHHSVVKTLFERPFVSKWLFDVELLFRLKNEYPNAQNKIIEVSLKKWEDVSGSKIGLSYFFIAPLDLLKIYFHYK